MLIVLVILLVPSVILSTPAMLIIFLIKATAQPFLDEEESCMKSQDERLKETVVPPEQS